MGTLLSCHEFVIFVGFTLDDPDFIRLHKQDRDHFHDLAMMESHPDGIRVIYRGGQPKGYGIPVLTATSHDGFREMDPTTLLSDIELARIRFRKRTVRIKPSIEPKVYWPHAV